MIYDYVNTKPPLNKKTLEEYGATIRHDCVKSRVVKVQGSNDETPRFKQKEKVKKLDSKKSNLSDLKTDDNKKFKITTKKQKTVISDKNKSSGKDDRKQSIREELLSAIRKKVKSSK